MKRTVQTVTDINDKPNIVLLMWKNISQHRGMLFGISILGAMLILALLAPIFSLHDPYETDLTRRILPPVWDARGSWDYLFGTDHLGRDYLSRLLHGARISLLIGFLAASIGLIIGVTLGVISGYLGGYIDLAINYLLSCQLALPGLLLAMSLVFLIGPSVLVVVCVIGVLHWSLYLVVTRTATMQIKQLDYINAARALSSSKAQIIFHEILPNLFNQIIVIFTLEVGIAIIAEASLSFLGVGVQAPTPSWGLMISEGKASMFFRPWLVVLPGIALFFLVISINLIGDGLRDITSPENRN